jgi:hypothetical protein
MADDGVQVRREFWPCGEPAVINGLAPCGKNGGETARMVVCNAVSHGHGGMYGVAKVCNAGFPLGLLLQLVEVKVPKMVEVISRCFP